MDNLFNDTFVIHIAKIATLLFITVLTILFAIVPLVQKQFR
jgi:hypothetical protein